MKIWILINKRRTYRRCGHRWGSWRAHTIHFSHWSPYFIFTKHSFSHSLIKKRYSLLSVHRSTTFVTKNVFIWKNNFFMIADHHFTSHPRNILCVSLSPLREEPRVSPERSSGCTNGAYITFQLRGPPSPIRHIGTNGNSQLVTWKAEKFTNNYSP